MRQYKLMPPPSHSHRDCRLNRVNRLAQWLFVVCYHCTLSIYWNFIVLLGLSDSLQCSAVPCNEAFSQRATVLLWWNYDCFGLRETFLNSHLLHFLLHKTAIDYRLLLLLACFFNYESTRRHNVVRHCWMMVVLSCLGSWCCHCHCCLLSSLSSMTHCTAIASKQIVSGKMIMKSSTIFN